MTDLRQSLRKIRAGNSETANRARLVSRDVGIIAQVAPHIAAGSVRMEKLRGFIAADVSDLAARLAAAKT